MTDDQAAIRAIPLRQDEDELRAMVRYYEWRSMPLAQRWAHLPESVRAIWRELARQPDVTSLPYPLPPCRPEDRAGCGAVGDCLYQCVEDALDAAEA